MKPEDLTTKPLIGIMPRNIHDFNRAMNIIEAMARYIEANRLIPSSWLNELDDLYGKGEES